MVRAWRQFKAVFRIYFRETLVYPASWFIWIFTDAIHCFAMPLVFMASVGQGGFVAGMPVAQFFLYYALILPIGAFVTSHFMWEIAFEVKDGVFTSHIIRPVNYFWFTFSRNFSWRVVRLGFVLPVFALFWLSYKGYLSGAELHIGWPFWLSLILGHIVSITFVAAMGMIALVVQEAQSIFGLYYIPMLFLSGTLFPISLLPDWARIASYAFPFYFTTGVPADIAVGRLGAADLPLMLGLQVMWCVLSYLGFRVIWAYGIRKYTGVGM